MDKPKAEFFAEQNAWYIDSLIIDWAGDYSDALAKVETYQKNYSPDAREGMIREVKETQEFKDLENVFGSAMGEYMLGDKGVEVKPLGGDDEAEIKEEEYTEKLGVVAQTSRDLADLVTYLQENAQTKLIEFELCASEEEANETSWRGVWTRLVSNLKPVGGIVLADVADLFDGMVRWKYHHTFNPVDIYRGEQAKSDVSTRTFYDVFAPHLGRAIMRSGEDNWTGY